MASRVPIASTERLNVAECSLVIAGLVVFVVIGWVFLKALAVMLALFLDPYLD